MFVGFLCMEITWKMNLNGGEIEYSELNLLRKVTPITDVVHAELQPLNAKPEL